MKIEKLKAKKIKQEPKVTYPTVSEMINKVNEIIEALPKNKIELLKPRREFDGIHQYETIYPNSNDVFRKVNEIIDYINKYEKTKS